MKLSAKFESKRATTNRQVASAPKQPQSQNQATTESAPSSAARNLALAHHVERLINEGVITDYTHAAQILSVSQPRMTHLMSLILLAPSIQEAILLGRAAPKDKELRELARIAEWAAQELAFQTLEQRACLSDPSQPVFRTG